MSVIKEFQHIRHLAVVSPNQIFLQVVPIQYLPEQGSSVIQSRITTNSGNISYNVTFSRPYVIFSIQRMFCMINFHLKLSQQH